MPPSQYFMYRHGGFFPLLLHFCFFVLSIEDYVCSMFSACPKYGGRRRKLVGFSLKLSFISFASCLGRRNWNIFGALSNTDSNCWRTKQCFLSLCPQSSNCCKTGHDISNKLQFSKHFY